MDKMRSILRVTALRCTLVMVACSFLLGAADSEDRTAAKVYASAEQTKPLQPGAKAPKLTLHTVEGKDFDLNASIFKQPTILIFYRGGW